MKTAIQKLISSVELMAQGLNAEELYEYFIKEANRLLPAERQQIERAFDEGQKSMYNPCESGCGASVSSEENAKQYFTNTYNE